jgi:hypothetical protein
VVTGELLEGNQVVNRDFARDQIPYYYKEGAIIPLYPKLSHLKIRPDKLILQFAPGVSGEFILYEDEEDNDNYEMGACTYTKVTQSKDNAVSTYTIHPRQGAFAGMPQQRAWQFELLHKSIPSSIEFLNGATGTYQYNAETRAIIIDLAAHSCDETITVKVTE